MRLASPRTRGVVSAVDPRGRQPELLGGHVVVVEALGGVEDPVAGTSIVANASANGPGDGL